MSRMSTELISCPKCGKESEFVVWSSLNADIDPTAKQKLLSGTLFNFTCSHCGNMTNVLYPILYHDMTHSAMVYLVDEDSVEKTQEMFSGPGYEPVFGNDEYRVRIVTHPHSLREKAIIFDNGLDDRVIEIVKLIFRDKLSERLNGKIFSAVYFRIFDGNYLLDFLGDSVMTMPFERSFYEEIRDKYSAVFSQDNSETIVDTQWAEKCILENDE